MNTELQTKVEQVDINLDEIFDVGAGNESVIVPEEKPSIFKREEGADFSFTESDDSGEENNTESDVQEVFDEINNFDSDDDLENSSNKKRGPKTISGVNDVFSKLIEKEILVPFEDDKPLEEYSVKDFEELIAANFQEIENRVRQETPKEFFESLPQELQIAAKYIADGGDDLKGLFSALAQTEEKRSLDISKEQDQETIIRDYLRATNYGTEEEIDEEIDLWKDLGKLEKQAAKFKPKLDKMQEKILARKLEEQEARRRQQEEASQMYMQNVYETLKEGKLGDLKLDKKTQAMLYNGLVKPNYPSVSGRNTNLLGHLLEKYQFVEPDYSRISEALWLLSDPDGYKAKIREQGSQEQVEKTVRKLKTEQANRDTGSQDISNNTRNRKPSKTIKRQTNIFKRF